MLKGRLAMGEGSASDLHEIAPSKDSSLDEKLLNCFSVFFGFFAALSGFFLLFFESPLITLSVASNGFPATACVVFLTTVFFLFIRMFAHRISSSGGLILIRGCALVGLCIAPFLLLGDLWVAAIPLIALGVAALSFSWCIVLCSLGHVLLDWLTAISFAFSACMAGLLWAANIDTLFEIVLLCSAFLVSLILLGAKRDRPGDDLLKVNACQSKKRAITAKVDRWTYSIIGLNFGFAIQLIVSQLQRGEVPQFLAASLVFCPIIVASILLLFFHYKFQFALEKYSKDFLSFVVAVCILPLTVVPAVCWIGFLMAFLLVAMLQIIIFVNAFLEFIRFEELSPAWYLAEGSFVSAGVCIGIVVGWVGLSSFSSWQVFSFCCYMIVLANVFAQVFFNRGQYPHADLFSVKPDKTDHSADVQTGGVAKGAAFWHARIDYVCKKYDLSPRQSEVLELLAKGRDIAFMVDYFCISRSTAKTHVYNIYCKLDIHSRQDLLDMIDSTNADMIHAANTDVKNQSKFKRR